MLSEGSESKNAYLGLPSALESFVRPSSPLWFALFGFNSPRWMPSRALDAALGQAYKFVEFALPVISQRRWLWIAFVLLTTAAIASCSSITATAPARQKC